MLVVHRDWTYGMHSRHSHMVPVIGLRIYYAYYIIRRGYDIHRKVYAI